MKVEISKLIELSLTALLQSGMSNEDAEIVTNHLLDEELLGKHSHGFIRLPSIINCTKSFEGKGNFKYEWSSESIVRLIAENEVGLVAAYKATECAISIADKYGFAMVSSIGYSGTTGALGYYARLIASKGLIGIISCTSEYAVAPWGGKDAILGTNPIAVALPNKDNPIISDFSTAAMTYGDLMLAAKESREVPYGIVLDKEGKQSHNPNDANDGCQLPMAEHKGYALGLAVEVLAGLFIGAKSGKESVIGSDGFLILSFKPNIFIPENQYFNNIASLVKEIKNSALASESSGIRTPGEGSVKKIITMRESGICEMPDVIFREISKL